MNADPHAQPLHPEVPLREPAEVMRLARMGSFFPTRLSFMRTLVRRLAADQVEVTRPVWDIDAQGYGRAVYTVKLGGHAYSLVAFSTPLDPDRRTDRVIAEAWDSSYVLFDGIPDQVDLDRLAINTPHQEAARFTARELTLSRANKSVRLFEHVVERLSRGAQPDPGMIGTIGYLMRTTAVYGNGKFGIADRLRIQERPALSGPFQVEMLTVWLIRGFTHDLVEHVARARNPERAVPLDRALKRHLGIGNATGLGMAPFLVSHPILLNNWMMVRETALARVRALPHANETAIARIQELLARARRHLDQWNVEDRRQMERVYALRGEIAEIQALASADWLAAPNPWDRLFRASTQHSLECQELVAALLLEPHGDLIDGLTDCMGATIEPRLDPAMPLEELQAIVETKFAWALNIDFAMPQACRRFWYVSEEKLEPRLGDRFEEAGAERERPLDIARQVQLLHCDLRAVAATQSLPEFLMRHPQHRHATRRAQATVRYPYSEIQDNLIAADCLPIDMLRCKLSFFGASKFDPKSDLWTRITLYQGAPLHDELTGHDADDWWLPVLEASASASTR